ncbi:MAG: M23 family metallopeptidase [Treponema sp.]|nr:M23 family metallopeptidase [Treponema sp.]
MNHRRRFLWLLLGISAVLAAAEETIHVIQKGDTIYSLARTYGVSSQEIQRLNRIDDPDRIQVGQRIRIPGVSTGAAFAPEIRGVTEHRTVRGETLYGISRLYGISLRTLLAANGLSENYTLKIGDLLRIPGADPSMAAFSAPSQEPMEGVPPAAVANPGMPVPAMEAIPGAIPPGNFSGAVARSTVSRSLDLSIPWPINAREIAYMTGKLNGVALVGERNEPVRSLKEGVVISAGPYRGFGKVVIIQVAGGYLYVYGGCENLLVREGDTVKAGTELGSLGIDALSEKPQLFFLVYRNNVSMDPAAAPRG